MAWGMAGQVAVWRDVWLQQISASGSSRRGDFDASPFHQASTNSYDTAPPPLFYTQRSPRPAYPTDTPWPSPNHTTLPEYCNLQPGSSTTLSSIISRLHGHELIDDVTSAFRDRHNRALGRLSCPVYLQSRAFFHLSQALILHDIWYTDKTCRTYLLMTDEVDLKISKDIR
ncbi:hypothetical protein AUEXF2481DRAFT_92294 [Aureobasidium subglaciale EXF-2481]|uniref:Uncharacterized protein n=1 Tax=Aureobasidium subglaciale (strain EXF-2481) TaxID=1043005 RepID=A0A074Y0N1_AURSE|nr:uncharacterized protein AUEXF2481DRAFT_92294 [Aureobasidium subglaciale EXF-2481]KEQ91285.1 hypothetical protein AUEXF2481DRAFT_92294 [Aureobasidium subglaciale EXF-2481]